MSEKIKKFITGKTINIVVGTRKFQIPRLIEEIGKDPVETDMSKKIMAIFEEAKKNPDLLNAETSPIMDLIDIDRLTANSPFHIDPVQCKVFIHGVEVDEFFSKKIIQLHEEKKPFEYIINFYKRFEKNTNENAKKELFLFLAHNGLPITKEGYFIGYKTVRSDYYSSYNYSEGNPNNVLNMPGTWVVFDRSKVDPDRHRTCSYGLHVANYYYATKCYGSPKTLTLVVDPADVVAVPSDYSNQKMRVCAYFVLEDCKGEFKENFIDLGDRILSREGAVVTSVTEEVPDVQTLSTTYYKQYKNSNGSIFKYKKKNGKGKNLHLIYIDEVTGATFNVYISVGVPLKWEATSQEIAYQSNVIKVTPKAEDVKKDEPVKDDKKPSKSKTLKGAVELALGDKPKGKKKVVSSVSSKLKDTVKTMLDKKTTVDEDGKVSKVKALKKSGKKK